MRYFIISDGEKIMACYENIVDLGLGKPVNYWRRTRQITFPNLHRTTATSLLKQT